MTADFKNEPVYQPKIQIENSEFKQIFRILKIACNIWRPLFSRTTIFKSKFWSITIINYNYKGSISTLYFLGVVTSKVGERECRNTMCVY